MISFLRKRREINDRATREFCAWDVLLPLQSAIKIAEGSYSSSSDGSDHRDPSSGPPLTADMSPNSP
jgi:hypothetical protein